MISYFKMCLQFDYFDSESAEVEQLLAGCLLDGAAKPILYLSNATSSCRILNQSEMSGCAMPDEAFNSIEVQIQIVGNDNSDHNSTANNPIPEEESTSTSDVKNVEKSTFLNKVYKIGAKSEAFRDEMLITLVGVTGQNAIQTACTSTSNLRYAATVANVMAFNSLLSGVVLRSKATMEVDRYRNRIRLASNLLVMLGISLTAAGPVFNMSMNFPGAGGYFISILCLLPIIVIFT